MKEHEGAKGVLVISLDFELYWGVRDRLSLKEYEANLLGVHQVVPQLLAIFREYGIHATWATVGMMFAAHPAELAEYLPANKPQYTLNRLSPYPYLEILEPYLKDRRHFAPGLIHLVAETPGQEVGTHTFSHYYCLEEGQELPDFREDLQGAMAIAKDCGIQPHSLVFPRNQVNEAYLPTCLELGIRAYRGNPPSQLYGPILENNQTLLTRGLRLCDTYVNLTGHNTYPISRLVRQVPVNIPVSRFLRPFSPSLRMLEQVRLSRILSDLSYAARRGHLYHLCWHPHNFGIHQEANLAFLRKVLDHFHRLHQDYGLESLNMGELAQRLLDNNT